MTNAKTRTTTTPSSAACAVRDTNDFIGLFPAAGHAKRMTKDATQLRGSKEIAPVPDLQNEHMSIAVGDYLMREYRTAGIDDVIVIRRKEKQDIAEHYSSPAFSDLNIIDLVTSATPSTAHSIDRTWSFIQQRPVALGFPDIIINPPGVFTALCNEIKQSATDVCIGLFPALHPSQSDMVWCENDRVKRIDIKPRTTELTLTWSCAVWQPTFSAYLHQSIANFKGSSELFIGCIFQAAIDAGLQISAVVFEKSLSLDIGTPTSYKQAQKLTRSTDLCQVKRVFSNPYRYTAQQLPLHNHLKIAFQSWERTVQPNHLFHQPAFAP